MKIPRPEYPRPQFVRPDWLNLNGEWEFEIDAGDSGLPRGLLTRPLARKIIVPFCPESELSGIHHVDFMPAVWYRRRVTIPVAWKARQVLLHFGAVDYDATVWVNGTEVQRHRGGFTSFTCDLRGVDGVTAGGGIEIVVRARDSQHGPQPRGKQSTRYENYSCLYTRTTGIWQTVWLEPVPASALQRPRITPDVARSLFTLEQGISGSKEGLKLRATLKDSRGAVTQETVRADLNFTATVNLVIPDERRRLWSQEDPHLYDLEIELLDAGEEVIDSATSYAGLRSVSIEGMAVLINGKKVFQRLVLDQGFYPDGILTAPTDAALRRDIELSLAAGFNGARLHQKVFEERFLYHADQLGYLVWGEFPDWGYQGFGPAADHIRPGASYITEWIEAVERDYSHPAIIGWCPLNESSQPMGDGIQRLDEVTAGMFLATKLADRTRPVIDASGYSHRVRHADIYDCHDYEQVPEKFARTHAGLLEGKPFVNTERDQAISVPYHGQPYFVSEFGGIWWNPEAKPGEDSWGYGERPKSIDEVYERFAGLCAVLLDNPNMFGYCYTQLTDVYQEQNGIYRFDRSLKLDVTRIRAVQQRPAAIETVRW
jgi:beta-galactosidase/beta-glucuronidase